MTTVIIEGPIRMKFILSTIAGIGLGVSTDSIKPVENIDVMPANTAIVARQNQCMVASF